MTLDELKAGAKQDAANLAEAARRYAGTDQHLGDKFNQQQFDRNGQGQPGAAPGSGTPGSGTSGGAGQSGNPMGEMMGQMGQLMQMPMQMASQLGQMPMQMVGMAGAVPQAVMQGVQQFSQMSGQFGKGQGQNKDPLADQPQDDKPDQDKAKDDKPAEESGQQPGAAPEAKPQPAPAPVHQGAGPGYHRLEENPDLPNPPFSPPVEPVPSQHVPAPGEIDL
ncbi:hypothetical protein [Mycobacterium kyorinense]|uniref:Translation initiation factor IF-2 n=1 Tax=Mycobacterium kyorinense TaxID=487514 RepID=A0A1X1YH11_9MYCO|nr:hypothetical protein [Mycobacterium kyorinense]ORW10402.1 hypothetical protein AWC14_20375 [Mycobacterium kyorinense]